MKTKSAFFLAAAIMAFSFTGCGNSQWSYSSESDVTIDKIIEHSRPSVMLQYKGGYSQTIDYEGFDEEQYEGLNDADFYYLYKLTDGKLEINQGSTYSDGYATLVYMSDDSSDPYVYTRTTMGNRKDDFDESELDSMKNSSVLGYDDIEAQLTDVSKEGEMYVCQVTILNEGEEIGHDQLTIDPSTGFVTKVISTDEINGQEVTITSEFTFTSDIEIDITPKTEYTEPEEMTEDDASSDESAE